MSFSNKIRRGEYGVRIPTTETALDARLAAPDGARALVVFADGDGRGTTNPADRAIASALYDWGIATLLVDFLTPGERGMDERTGRFRNDVGLLSRRLVEATRWVGEQPHLDQMHVGFLGSGTGAAAAVVAAAGRADHVNAVVALNGRLELVASTLPRTRVPVMLLAGEHNDELLNTNRFARRRLRGECDLIVLPDGGRTLTEPRALEIASTVIRGFFCEHLQHADDHRLPH